MPYNSKRVKLIDIGTKFGSLTVIGEPTSHTTGKTTRAMFPCQCNCGRKTWITGSQLRSTKRTRCSHCAYKERPQSTEKYSDLERCYNLYIIGRCKKSKIENFLSLEEYGKIVSQNCYYCGEPPRKIKHLDNNNKVVIRKSFYANGVDRVDPYKHYTIDNCVPCCKQCNVMKMIYTKKEFFDKIKKIYNKWSKQEGTIKANLDMS